MQRLKSLRITKTRQRLRGAPRLLLTNETQAANLGNSLQSVEVLNTRGPVGHIATTNTCQTHETFMIQLERNELCHND